MVHFPMVQYKLHDEGQGALRQYSWQIFVSKRFSCEKAETRTEKKTIEEGVRREGRGKKPPAINPLRLLKCLFQYCERRNFAYA